MRLARSGAQASTYEDWTRFATPGLTNSRPSRPVHARTQPWGRHDMHRLIVSIILALGLGALATAANAAPDAARGAKLFDDRCSFCHSFAAGENGEGPSLHGVYGRPTGNAAGFGYSPGLASHKATWTNANLNRFLTSPQGFSPGSQMPVSTPSAQDRADLIAYLAKAGAGK